MSSSVTFVMERETAEMDQTKKDVVSFCGGFVTVGDGLSMSNKRQ